MDTQQAGSGALSVTVDGPSKVQLNCEERENGYEFNYVPSLPGNYLVAIKYGSNNQHISGSFIIAENFVFKTQSLIYFHRKSF